MICQRILTKTLSPIINIRTLRRLSVKRNGDSTKTPIKKKQKRGPQVATLKIKPDHFPPDSAKPRVNNFSCAIVKTHIENRYGIYIDGLQLHVVFNLLPEG